MQTVQPIVIDTYVSSQCFLVCLSDVIGLILGLVGIKTSWPVHLPSSVHSVMFRRVNLIMIHVHFFDNMTYGYQ